MREETSFQELRRCNKKIKAEQWVLIVSQLEGTKDRRVQGQGLPAPAGLRDTLMSDVSCLETVVWQSRLSLAGHTAEVTQCSTGFKGPEIQTRRNAHTGQRGA